MDKFVTDHDIAHFRKQLAGEIDEMTRLMLARLPAEEEAKLAALPNARERKRCQDG